MTPERSSYRRTFEALRDFADFFAVGLGSGLNGVPHLGHLAVVEDVAEVTERMPADEPLDGVAKGLVVSFAPLMRSDTWSSRRT
jgi:hypothetical protein